MDGLQTPARLYLSVPPALALRLQAEFIAHG